MTRAEEFQGLRPLLFAIAYRILGSVGEAEDAVQEAWLRFDASPTAPTSTKAFLSAVVARISIDVLRSARRRREEYVGPWFPEPLLADPYEDPQRSAELAGSLSMAALLLPERLSPPERAVFVLREVFGFAFADVADPDDPLGPEPGQAPAPGAGGGPLGGRPRGHRSAPGLSRTHTSHPSPTAPGGPVDLALWIVADLLAAVALVGGVTKVFVPREKLAAAPGGGWTGGARVGVVKTLGVLELVAAAGLVLPAVVGVAPVLVPVTAACWVVLMLGAMVTHGRRGETRLVVLNLLYLAMAAFVVWGRFGAEPFAV